MSFEVGKKVPCTIIVTNWGQFFTYRPENATAVDIDSYSYSEKEYQFVLQAKMDLHKNSSSAEMAAINFALSCNNWWVIIMISLLHV